MIEKPASGQNIGGRMGAPVKDDVVSAWLIREILPLEAILMTYLRQNWRNPSELVDLRQEIYVRVLQAAREQIPDNPKRFLLTCARNLLINLVKRGQVVPIEAVADLDSLNIATDAPQPDHSVMARDELRRLKTMLDQLPARMREAIALAYFEGLSGKEIAERMGITKSTASQHLARGAVLLTDILNEASIGPSSK